MKSHLTNLEFIGRSLLRTALFLAGIIFLSPQDASATHIVGGDLTYQCLGPQPNGYISYRIRLTVRRDCQFGAADAPFDNPAAIGLYDLTTGLPITDAIGFPFGEIRIAYNSSDTLNEQLMSDCSVVAGPVCVETFVYDTIVQLLPRATGYIFAYQRCCRNHTINNLLNPLETGMTLVAELSGAAQMACNSSPQFGEFPPVYVCVNRPINFDHSAVDLEGDSLVYELCTPLGGGSLQNPKPNSPFTGPPYPNVVFRPPYSLSNLMGGVPLQMDPQTGLITGTPNTIGQFVVGICVTAYRNGVVTGRTRRDFQFNVRQCRDVPTPAFFAPALDCEDLTVEFDNQSQLADEFLWIFDLDDPNSATSPLFEPSFTYPQGGCYDVALVVNVLEGNERFCIDTIVHEVCVFDSQLDAEFSWDVSACTNDIVLVLTDASVDPSFDVVSWEWIITTPGGIDASTNQNPVFSFPVVDSATVLAVLTVTSSNGCTALQTHSFPVKQITVNVDPDSEHLCRGDSTGLLIGADPSLMYTWSPTEGLNLDDPWNPQASPATSTVYSVTVTDGLCEVTVTIPVEVQQLPVLAFEYETDCKSLTVQFHNNSTGILYQWDFGTGVTSQLENPIYTFPDSGIYVVTLSSRDGCDVSISREVTTNAITEELDDTATNCFMPGIFLNPDPDTGYLYIWSGGLPNVPNPFASPADDTEYFVTISSPGLPGCEIIDSITVLVPDDFDVGAGDDVTTCLLDPITLTATVINGVGDYTFIWSDGTPGPVNVVNPAVTATYYVTATDSLGCSMTDSVMVIKPPSGFDVDILTSDTAYCNIQMITLSGVSIPGSNVTLEWFNAMNPDQMIGEGANVLVTPGGPAQFILIGTDSVSMCQESDTVTLTPTFFDLTISPDQNACIEDISEIFVIDNLGQNLTFMWSPAELILTGVVNDTATVNPSQTTTFSVLVTNADLQCTTTLSTTVTIDVFDPLIVTITSDPPPPITLTQPVQLTVNQPGNFGYMWSSSNPAENIPSISDPVVTPTQNPTIYTVTVTNLQGCTQVASIAISVDDPDCNEKDIFLPNAFTPNGDGVNDILYVRSNFISSLDLYIYNRWGEKVFESHNQADGWNGTYNGKVLPPDVYGFYMEIGCPNQKTYFKKGNITILH